MRAYRRFRKRTSLRYCVYLTESERTELLRELMARHHPTETPTLTTLLRHVQAPREDGWGMGGEQ